MKNKALQGPLMNYLNSTNRTCLCSTCRTLRKTINNAPNKRIIQDIYLRKLIVVAYVIDKILQTSENNPLRTNLVMWGKQQIVNSTTDFYNEELFFNKKQ